MYVYDAAWRVLNKMKKSRVFPNSMIYNTIIRGYVKFGRVQELDTLLAEMEKRGQKKDIYTYTTILNACR